MNRHRLLFLAFISVFASSLLCSQTPAQNSTEPAHVYFLHPHNSFVGRLDHPVVFCDGTPIQRVESHHFFVTDLPPGPHAFSVGFYATGNFVTLESGKSYYFKTTLDGKPHLMANRPLWTIDPISAEEATSEMQQMKQTTKPLQK
jgi:hypothetical protein